MARYTGPVCRLCKRYGDKMSLMAGKCSAKCEVEKRRAPAAGARGTARRRRVSEYSLRLAEKQKARFIYGVLERQFRRFYAIAERRPGMTGENLLQLLEMRLDSVVYRLGFAESRGSARQLVSHGHMTVNEKPVNIPSYLVKVGDVIGWKKTDTKLLLYQTAAENIKSKAIPNWLSVDPDKMTGRVLAAPARNDIEIPINERLIVDFYSR